MAANSNESKFSISWHDSAWVPILNSENVLDYFCQRSNTFYDKTCNNEHVKMQRLDLAQLQFMTGIEYTLIHTQDPILYVIRKQMRYAPQQVTSLATYYILSGVVYQAPDVGSLINSRLLSTVHKIESAFTEAQSYSRYNPSKGYWWQFKDKPEDTSKKEPTKNKALEASSVFQRQRVNLLLNDFTRKFPPKVPPPPEKAKDDEEAGKVGEDKIIKEEPKSNTDTVVKTESIPSPSVTHIVNATSDPTNRPLTPATKRRKKE